jgi:hypothetical protein
VYEKSIAVNPSFPNDSEIYPILASTSSKPSGTGVTGTIEQSETVTVDLYSDKSCALQSDSPGQGEHFLGSRTVHSKLGTAFFSLTFAPTPAGQRAITATATGSDGSTSEFSPCLNTNSKAPSLVGYGVGPTSTMVPVTSSPAAAAETASAASAKKPVGRGTLVLLCPARTTGSCAGTVVVTTTGRHPTTLIRGRFKMKPGLAAQIRFTVSSSLFARIKKAKRMTVKANTTAHDGGRHPHHKTRNFKLKLVLA